MLIATLVMLLLSIIPNDGAEANSSMRLGEANNSESHFSHPQIARQTCAEAWFEASSISNDDIQNPLTDLDNAVRTCTTLSSWYSEAVKYPQLLSGKSSIEVLVDRCDIAHVEAYICEWIRSNPDFVQSELR